MKQIKVTWKGVTPLLMHNNQGANPMHPLSKELKKVTSNRKKTDEDHALMSDIEWKLGLYYNEEDGLYVPGEAIEATIRSGAQQNRLGTSFKRYLQVDQICVPLDIGEKFNLDKMLKDFRYRDSRIVTVQKSKIVRTRPRFDRWKCTFTITYEEQYLNLEDIINAIDYAGKFVGFLDYRPRYGKFEAIIEELPQGMVE